jgi:hypothetical protein
MNRYKVTSEIDFKGKKLKVGEEFDADSADVAAVRGSVDKLFVHEQKAAADKAAAAAAPAVQTPAPVNE